MARIVSRPKARLRISRRSLRARTRVLRAEREGIAWLPVYERDDPDGRLVVATSRPPARHRKLPAAQPLFFVLPADIRDYTSATVPLYEYRADGNGHRFYSIEGPTPNARAGPRPRILGRVWRNPSRAETLVNAHSGRAGIHGPQTIEASWDLRATAERPSEGGDELGIAWPKRAIDSSDPAKPARSETSSSNWSAIPTECWHAMEGLALVEPEVRVAIIAELSRHQQNSGTSSLLHLLCSVRDPATRLAARAALGFETAETTGLQWFGKSRRGSHVFRKRRRRLGVYRCRWTRSSRSRIRGCLHLLGCGLVGCLVTPVNGRGCGSIAVSASQRGQRRTAAFLCDVRRGIRDVVGDVEPESPGAGRLIDELSEQVGEVCVRDVPELAVGLLAGSLMIVWQSRCPRPCATGLPGSWGRTSNLRDFPRSIPGWPTPSISSDEMPTRAGRYSTPARPGSTRRL